MHQKKPRLLTLSLVQAEYASSLLFIASLCLSKVAALLFVRGLTLDTIDLNLTTGLCIFVGVWGVVSEFAVAFQCHLPKPWDYIHNTCFNRVGVATSPDNTECLLTDLGGVVELLRRGQYPD